jgi:hypothetical protein
MDTDSGDPADTTGTPHGSGASVLVLAEDDYCFGQGELTLRVERVDVADPVVYRGDTWYRVCGVQVRWDGRMLHRREILVRTRLIHPAPTRP